MLFFVSQKAYNVFVEHKTYNIDKLEWHIEEYQQRSDRKIKTIVIDNKPLTKKSY
jgi:hypothetical protein